MITNNHFEGKAVANAFQLARRLRSEGETPAPPAHLVRRYPVLSDNR